MANRLRTEKQPRFEVIFLVVFACWALEFSYLSFAPLRRGQWIVSWHAWLNTKLGLRKKLGTAGVLATIAVPCSAIAYLFHAVLSGSTFFSLCGGVVVLLLCCGPGDLTREFDAYVSNYMDDTQSVSSDVDNMFSALRAQPGSPDEPYMRALAVAANDRIFAPTFWFVILGPMGALLFRMSSKLKTASNSTDTTADFVSRLYAILIWIPVRLLSVALGLAGSLGPVMLTLRRRHYGLAKADKLLGDAAMAGLDSRASAAKREDVHIESLTQMLNFVKRAFVVWLVVLGLLALADII